jgi:hypothetical protein
MCVTSVQRQPLRYGAQSWPSASGLRGGRHAAMVRRMENFLPVMEALEDFGAVYLLVGK